MNLIRHLSRVSNENDDFDESDDVVAFIDSTDIYDFVEKIDGNKWEWHSDYYEPTYGYVLVKKPLWEIINLLKPFD